MPGIQIVQNYFINLITETEHSWSTFTLTSPSVSLGFVTYLEETENYNFELVYSFYLLVITLLSFIISIISHHLLR